MELVSKPEGYTNNQISYANPIPSLPPPKTLHDKKDTTLLDMALRNFLKQRLYGDLLNFDKKNTQKKNHLGRYMTPRERSASSYSNINNSENSEQKDLLKYTNKRYHSPLYKSKGELQTVSQFRVKNKKQNKILPLLSIKQRVNQGHITERKNSHIYQNARVRINHSALSNLQDENINLKGLSDKLNPEKQVNTNHVSFISAVDFEEPESKLQISQEKKKRFKLPYLKEKGKQNIATKTPNFSKNAKLLFQKQLLPNVKIQKDLWEYLISNNMQLLVKGKRKRKMSKQFGIQSLKQQLKAIKNVKQNCSLGVQYLMDPSPKFSKKITEKDIEKDKISQFLTQLQDQVSNLVKQTFQFFQLNSKLTQKIKIIDLQTALVSIFTVSPRAWSFVMFRCLDTNRDGKICASDLFKIYNKLNQKIEDLQQKVSYLSAHHQVDNNPSHQECIQLPQKKKYAREKTQLSQVSKRSKKSKSSKNQSHIEQQKKNKMQMQQKLNRTMQILRNITISKFQCAKILKKQLQKLNKLLLKKSQINSQKINSHQNDQQNVIQEIKSINSGLKGQKILLEQALLKKTQVKYSNLKLILNESQKQQKMSKNTNKQVIDLDRNKLNFKLSSVYVQTFAATQHNEQTRTNRQYLQTLKQCLKEQNIQSQRENTQLESKKLSCIQYNQFLSAKLYEPFQKLFFSFLHAHIKHNSP